MNAITIEYVNGPKSIKRVSRSAERFARAEKREQVRRKYQQLFTRLVNLTANTMGVGRGTEARAHQKRYYKIATYLVRRAQREQCIVLSIS